MLAQFFSIAVIALLGAMLPGADFAVVTKNSLLYSRTSGYFTSLGVGAAIMVHMTYCVLGVAVIVAHSVWLFSLVKYIGASYLIYLGARSLLAKSTEKIEVVSTGSKKMLSRLQSFQQGFLCNLLNPKATLFFLSVFTVVIKPDTPMFWSIIYAAEIVTISTLWFCFLTVILSHPVIQSRLEKAEKYINKLFGVCLIGFGTALAFIKPMVQ